MVVGYFAGPPLQLLDVDPGDVGDWECAVGLVHVLFDAFDDADVVEDISLGSLDGEVVHLVGEIVEIADGW